MSERIVKVVLRGDVSGLVSSMRAGAQSVKDSADQMTAATKEAEKYRQGLSAVGKTAGQIGLVAAIGVGAVIAQAANFDQAMSRIDAATHETAENMDRLREAALQAGADTAFSATEAADAVTELAKAGVLTKDILGGGLKGALSLAAAGELEVGDAAEIAATALTQFRLAGAQIPHVADLLAAGAGKAQGGVDDLGMALKQGGLVAAQTGLSIEETIGALAEFASAGLLGSDAGTSFKTMLQALTPNSDEARAAIDKYNLSAYDAQGNFIGMTAFAGKLREGLKDLTVEQQNATLKTVFGSDAVRAAAIIFKDGAKGVDEWQQSVNDAGFAADTAARKQDNLRGDIEKLTGSLSTLFITSGDGAQGPIRDLVQGLTNITNTVNSLPEPVKNAATGLLAITAVTGGALWFGTKVISGVTNTKQALDNLGTSAGVATGKLSKIGGTAVGILAVGTAVGALTDGLGRIDSSNLDRALTSLALTGDASKDLETVIDDIGTVTSKWNAIDLGEVVTLGGLFGDTSLDRAADNIDQVDKALANLVESGERAKASDIFAGLKDLAESKGVDPTKLAGQFDAYALALKNAAAEGGNAAAAVGETTGAVQILGASIQKLTEDQIADLQKAAADTAGQFLGFDKTLDESTVSLDDWITHLNMQATALEQFAINAETAAHRGLTDGLIKQLEAAGPAGALRMKQLADGADSEITRANRAFGRGQTAAQDLQDTMANFNPLSIIVDSDQADERLKRLDRILERLGFGIDIPVHFVQGQGPLLPNGGLPLGPATADGGTIGGARYPYGDKVLTPTAPGEYITSNRYGQADKNRAALEAGNRGATLGVIGGMAAGGTVGDPYLASVRYGSPGMAAGGTVNNWSSGAAAQAPGIDYERLAAVVLSARPLVGHQTVMPHNYSEFRRQQRELESMAASSGVEWP